MPDEARTAPDCALTQPPPLLSVIVPTRNEAGNIAPLLARLLVALDGVSAEVVFVDDSTDDTPAVIGAMQAGAMQASTTPLDVRLIARPEAAAMA